MVIKEPSIEGVSGILKDELIDLSRQKPNKRLLGVLPFTYLVFAHEAGKARFDSTKYQRKIEKKSDRIDKKIERTKRDSRIARLTRKKNTTIDELNFKIENGNWLMQTGESLAVYDSNKTTISLSNFKNHLIANGYFDHKITYEKISKSKKKSYAQYNLSTGERYRIDSIHYVYPDDTTYRIVHKEQDQSVLKTGSFYSQKKLESQRDFIYSQLTNNGYFYFSRQFITFEVDTFSIDGKKILLTEKILNPSNASHQAYTIDSVQFFSSTNNVQSEQIKTTSNGIAFQFEGISYSPEIISSKVFLRKNSFYSRDNTIKTQRQLSYLDAFKFVNINYDSIGNQKLIANIFTSPLKKYQTSLELGAVSASQQIPGPFINLGIRNRNAFNALDIIDLQGNFSIQGISNIGTENTAYSLFQFGTSLGYTLPKFLLLSKFKYFSEEQSINPQTRFQLLYNFENRASEYQRSSVELSYAYLWRKEDSKRFNFSPFTFSFIDVPVIQDRFEEFLVGQDTIGNGALRASFNSSVISSTSFDAIYDFSNSSNTSGNSFLRVFVETGGNLVNLLGEDFFLWSAQNNAEAFSLFRWAKASIDYRKVFPLNRQANLAYRVNFGVAYPYGKNASLPYLKRFYIGGSNSLRAWQVRRLGPGSFGETRINSPENTSIDLINYQIEQGGDMIIEASLEYRKNLVGFVDYALFVDAGNIWLVNSDVEEDDGFFAFNSFWKEFAIGAGLGLRFDFSFFVFRIDGAFQVHDPAQRAGNRWVIKEIPFGKIGSMTEKERNILANKTNITIGIGLPF